VNPGITGWVQKCAEIFHFVEFRPFAVRIPEVHHEEARLTEVEFNISETAHKNELFGEK
jgi:hypothetical protein